MKYLIPLIVFFLLGVTILLFFGFFKGLLYSRDLSRGRLRYIADRLEELMVYDIDVKDFEEGSGKRIETVAKAPFPCNIFTRLCRDAKYSRDPVLWKGGLLGVGRLRGGETVRLKLSLYGSFFMILSQPGYFYFDGKAKGVYEKELNKIIQRHFIPERIKRMKNRKK